MALLLLWTLLPEAAAQSPGLTASLASASSNARWVVGEVASKRFPGEEIAGPTFQAGEEVELILQEGDSARIRQGGRYGWVPASALTAVQPLVAPPGLGTPGGNPLLEGLTPLLQAPPAPAPAAPALAPAPAPAPGGAPNTP
jgi:hypothetical protein